jgi:hypothetical protein
LEKLASCQGWGQIWWLAPFQSAPHSEQSVTRQSGWMRYSTPVLAS